MKSLTPFKALMGALALAALAPLSLAAQSRPTFIGEPNLVRSEQPDMGPGIDAALARIGALALAGEDWQSAAVQADLHVAEDMVLIEISDGTGAEIPLLLQIIQEFDGQIMPNATTERCRAYVRPEFLSALEARLNSQAKQPNVIAFRVPVANAYGEVISEGEPAMKSNLYELDGDGTVIAVMDIGFDGLDAFEAEELFRPFEDGVTGTGSHGAAMVEVIRDIAPRSKILGYRIGESLDIYSATLDAVNQGANVIVSSLTWFDLPGRSQADLAARVAIDNGVQWVNAAGNFANARYLEVEHFGGISLNGELFVTPGGDDDPYQYIENPGDQIRIHLAQEGKSGLDALLALELYSWDGMSSNLVLEAAGNHNLRVQTIVHAVEPGKYYFPMMRLARDGQLRRVRMFSETGRLFFCSRQGSIACPGGTNGVITVGAVDAMGYEPTADAQPYSGRGGGIFDLNLDLCGPTNCSTGIYGPQRFGGTSAATAHVGGLVALHISDEAMARDPIGMIHKLDLGVIGHDADTGAGLAMAQVDDAEPDNTFASATDLIALGQSAGGRSLSPSHDQDWFSFEIAEQMSMDISISPAVPSAQLYLMVDGVLVQQFSSLSQPALNPGKYLLRIGGGFVADYGLTLELYQDAPQTVTKMSPANGAEVEVPMAEDIRVQLEWKAPQGLGPISYQVQVSNAAETRFLMADDITDDTSFSIGGLEFGQAYTWRVRAMNAYGQAAFSADQTFTVWQKPEAVGDTDVTAILSNDVGIGSLQDADEEAAGCVGNNGSNGLIVLLVVVAAAVMTRRKYVKAKA